MFDQLIDHLISGAEYPLRSSSHISRQRGQKAARRKSDRIKCKKGRNPKSRGEVRDRLPIGRSEKIAPVMITPSNANPQILVEAAATAPRRQAPSTADDVKTVRKAPAREVGLYRTAPYNINDAGNDEYYSQSSREDRRSKRGEFRNHRDVPVSGSQLPALTYGEYGFFAHFINQLTAIR
jgi:hypothetical protein